MKKTKFIIGILALQSTAGFAVNPSALISKEVNPRKATQNNVAAKKSAAEENQSAHASGAHHVATSQQHSVDPVNPEVEAPASEFISIAAMFSGIQKSTYANINRGNVLTGGSFSLTQTWYSATDTMNIGLGVPVQYFLIDRLALGGLVGLSHYRFGSTKYTDAYVGPAATLYFWDAEHIATYADTFLAWDFLHRSDDQLALGFGMGVDYFVTPSVAFGPKVTYTHNFGMGDRADTNTLRLAAAFRISL